MPHSQVGEPTFFKRWRPQEGDLAGAGTLDAAFDLIRMLDAHGYSHAFLRMAGLGLEFMRVARRTGHLIADVHIKMDTEEGGNE